jgi:hypothetical protein
MSVSYSISFAKKPQSLRIRRSFADGITPAIIYKTQQATQKSCFNANEKTDESFKQNMNQL